MRLQCGRERTWTVDFAPHDRGASAAAGTVEGVDITGLDRLIDRLQRLLGAEAVAETNQIAAWRGLQGVDQIAQHRAGADRAELLGVADQQHAGRLGQGLEHRAQEGQINH